MSLQADAANFVSEVVKSGKKGQQITLTFSVEGLPAGSNPVVGVFDKQGKIVGRTEWLSNNASPAFQKKFVFMHANSTPLTFSVYNASDAVSVADYLGGVSSDLKNLCGNGGKNDVTEGAITFHFSAETPKKGEKAKKEEKKVDPKEAAAARKKLVAKCDKEGGKKAQDLAGMRDLGGVSYFHVSIDEPKADWELLEACMKAMNAPCPEDADERRGGADEIGKVLMSFKDEYLALYMHVPSNLEACNIDEWFAACTDGYEVQRLEAPENYIKAQINANPDKNVFPIKVKDDCINNGYKFLCSKSLVRPDDDDEDDMVFGDDDFMM